ncbi:MAG: hypothetical protein KIT16_02470 [Rhodospirillaceae bacterium]|nr:hypothetical protein [Rhodospirillaceae bacterium]
MNTMLFPQPWVGPIRNAKAFVLQLNPGLSGEVGIESSNPAFRHALEENLNGNLPNLFLDSRFSSHPGRAWVERRMRGVAPMATIATTVAQLELFPYHSKSFSKIPRKIKKSLLDIPSVRAARAFVHSWVLPRAIRGDVGKVVLRSAEYWQIDDGEKSNCVVVHQGWERQNGHCTPRMHGGKLLQRLLNIQMCRA